MKGKNKHFSVDKLIVFEKAYEYVKWVIPTVERFPKSQRFTLAARITDHSLDLLDLIVEAQFKKERGSILDTINRILDKLRIFFRLSNELTYLTPKKYETGTKMLYEIGKLIGGWKKYAQ